MIGQVRKSLLVSVLFLLILQTGCLSFLNRIPEPPVEVRQQAESLPIESRSGVYVFLINGTDTLGCGNLYGIRNYLNQLGFVKSYYGEFFQEWWLIEEIRQLRKEKPDARIIVVGYEHGADAALSVAQAGIDAGANIDMLMYLEPKGLTFHDISSEHLGIRRLVVIRKDKMFFTDSDVSGSETIELPCSCRYVVPTHPTTLDILATEVAGLAMSIPVELPPVEAFPQILEDPAPTPRPITANKVTLPDEWDFLKPVSRRRDRPTAMSKEAVEKNRLAEPVSRARE